MNHNLYRLFTRLVAISLLLLFSSVSAQPQLSPEVGRGLQWLAAQVQAGGGVGGESASIASQFQNRSEAAQTLQAFVPPAPAQLVDALIATADSDTEYLARKIISSSLAGRVITPDVGFLLARRNLDGGFGAHVRFESHALDTAWTLVALQTSGTGDPSVIAGASDYLLSIQQANGSFGLRGNSSQYLTTAMVMMALQGAPRAPAVLEALNKASAFLMSKQAADGGWGSVAQSSSVYLSLLGSVNDTGLQSRVTGYLVSKQGADGSWGGDPYVSALALRALSAQPRPVPTTGDIVLQVVDGSSGLPIETANASFQGASTATVSSNLQGKISYTSALAGTYTVTVSALGYAVQNQNFTLQAGTRVDLGIVSLLPAPTTGILQGQVKDAVSGVGIQGALITITGSTVTSAITALDGSYRIPGVAPGAVVVSASKAGYASAGGSGTIVAGSILTFSPALQIAQVLGTTGGIAGLVRDASTTAPLAGVLITVSGAANGSVVSSVDGSYSLNGLAPGVVTVTASKAGYTSVGGSGTLAAGGVLTFNPSLLALGQPPLTTGGLSGQVKDSVTGLALGGVTITVAGVTTAITVTSADGSYNLTGLTVGAMTVTVSKAGYASVSGSGSIVAGEIVLFSPSLQSTVGAITGVVIDAATQLPLQGVAISVGAGSGNALTAADGRFSVLNLSAGGYSIDFSRTGYSTKSIAGALVTAGSTTDLQVIAMAKSLGSVSIFGKITDVITNLPIAGASVTVLGVGANATTDAAGTYRIDGLTTGTFTLRVGATGYASDAIVRSFGQFGEFQFDDALSAGQGSNIAISKVASVQGRYGAYAQADIQVEVQNTGGAASNGVVVVTIQDPEGKYLDNLEATWTDANGVVQRDFSFPVGATAISIPWNTKANAPGIYTVIAKVYQAVANPASGPRIELAEKGTAITIDPTAAILSVVLTPLPAFTNLGATERIGFKLDIVNRSNVAVKSSLTYQISSPSQVLVHGSSVEVSLDPQEDVKSLLLSGFTYQFMESGLFTSTINVSGGTVPGVLDAKPISVAPGTRIDPFHSVVPNVVTPDGDKRIRMDIRLQGVEQK